MIWWQSCNVLLMGCYKHKSQTQDRYGIQNIYKGKGFPWNFRNLLLSMPCIGLFLLPDFLFYQCLHIAVIIWRINKSYKTQKKCSRRSLIALLSMERTEGYRKEKSCVIIILILLFPASPMEYLPVILINNPTTFAIELREVIGRVNAHIFNLFTYQPP